MKSIGRFEGNNMELAEFLYVIFWGSIASVPEAVNFKITSDIILKTGKRWFKWTPTQGSLYYKEPSEKPEHGTSYNIEVGCSFPKDTPELLNLFSEMEEGVFSLLVKDNNGQFRFVDFMTFRNDFTNEGKNAHSIVFSSPASAKSFVYDGPLPDQGGSGSGSVWEC